MRQGPKTNEHSFVIRTTPASHEYEGFKGVAFASFSSSFLSPVPASFAPASFVFCGFSASLSSYKSVCVCVCVCVLARVCACLRARQTEKEEKGHTQRRKRRKRRHAQAYTHLRDRRERDADGGRRLPGFDGQ